MNPNQPEEGALEGRSVAITGRLASMKRDEAITLIGIVGGSYVKSPDTETRFLIVGEGGWPLRDDGRLTRSLEEARRLRGAGHAIEIMTETDFLVSAGLDDLRRLYTAQQLARILKVPAGTIGTWVRRDLIRPVKIVNRLLYFDFPTVSGAKLLHDLIRSGVPPSRIRESLQQLERWLPSVGKSLRQLGILESGGHLLVRLRDGALADPSGQIRLDFGSEPASSEARSLARPIALNTPSHEQSWSETAVRLVDAGRLQEAADAYHKALIIEGPHAEMAFNLANVLYELGRKEEAVQRFLQTVEIDPAYLEAWNNLANAQFDVGRGQDAVRSLRKALAVDPTYPDAHYNLAEILYEIGSIADARSHWQAYLDEDPNSSWAEHVRERLAATKETIV